MARRVRVTAITHTAKGRPLAPGDEVSLPDSEAESLQTAGKAVLIATTKKEKTNATSGK